MSLQSASEQTVVPVETSIANTQKMIIPQTAEWGRWLSPLMLAIFDYLSIVLGLIVAIEGRNWLILDGDISIHQFQEYIFGAIPVIYMSLMAFEGLYWNRVPMWQKNEKLFKITIYAIAMTIGLLFFEHTANNVSRMFLGLSIFTCFFFLLITRYLAKKLLALAGLWQRPVLLVGAGKTAELVVNAFEEDINLGYKIVGVVEDNHLRPLTRRIPLVGNFSDIESLVKTGEIDDVIIAAPGIEREKVLDLVYVMQPYVNNISIIPDLFGMPLTNIKVDTLFKQKTVMLKIKNNLLCPWNRAFKRIYDLVACSILLLVSWPIFLTIGFLIWRDSKGPIAFAHKRVGRNGNLFPCYKFRTMVPNAEKVLEEYLADNPELQQEWEREFKLKDDPRITRIGKFLRKTSLDELPQLFNIFKGEMSLVGPRPIVPKEVVKYKEYINDYYMVRPGLTGLWQVSGRNDIDYDTRVQMDSWYVRNWTFWLDVTMLLKTVKVVLDRKGAY